MNENFENTQSFKQLPEELKEFFAQLPEETKERIRNCKTEEEAMEILKSDMIPIPDEALDSVAGGVCYMEWGEGDSCYTKTSVPGKCG